MVTFSESDGRPETLSLAWKPRIISEPHASPGFKEVIGTKLAAGETPERVLRNTGRIGEDPNQPLCPMLPALKRHKENRLAFCLEGSDSDKRLNQ